MYGSFQNNITVSDDTNQQTSTESSTVDYSQGFSATYFEVFFLSCLIHFFQVPIHIYRYISNHLCLCLQERSSLQLQGFLQENEAHHNNK